MTDYPTPETDLAYDLSWEHDNRGIAVGIIRKRSELLERRLAVARQALQAVQAQATASGPFWFGGQIMADVKAALEATQPLSQPKDHD